eukprot:Gb_02938 [translate_table: standard]
MRQLIRKLQRVADPSVRPLPFRKLPKCDQTQRHEYERNIRSCRRSGSLDVPEGHLPIYVGKDLIRFVIDAHVVNHPLFAELLQTSAQEFGYQQKGGLRIPCDVMVFEHILCLINSEVSNAHDSTIMATIFHAVHKVMRCAVVFAPLDSEDTYY